MKKYIIGIVIIIVVATVAGWWYVARNNGEIQELVTVAKKDLVQEVNVTGRVKSADLVKLSFEISGRVENVYVKIGDRVGYGESLASLNQESLLAKIGEGKATVEVARAKLAELTSGARPEEIRVSEIKVENAKVAVEDAKKNAADKMKDSFTKSDDAIRNKVDQFFSNPRSNNPQMNFLISDSRLKSEIEWERFNLEGVLHTWKQPEDTSVLTVDLAQYFVDTKKNVDRVKLFLDRVAFAINSLTPTSSLNQTAIDGYKTDVSVARANVNTAGGNLLAADEKLRTARVSLTLAEQELTLAKAGPPKEQIASFDAEIRQAEAKVATLQVELEKTILRAPMNGMVTKLDVAVGEIVSPNAPVISLITESNLEIEVNVPEVDIGKISMGNPVAISYDAFPNETFQGNVVFIDPAETILDGVVNFRVRISFIKNDARIKSGLTANLSIETLRKSAVLALPQFAIIETDQGTLVKKMEGDAVREIPIALGIRSRDGMVEVLSGVVEGDRVQNIGLKNEAK